MSLYARFKEALERTALPVPARPVLIGVSGGPDSLAMLHLFCRLREESNLSLHVLHVQHGIRGEEAEADADFVAATCKAWDVPCEVERVNVGRIAEEYHFTLEDAARRARYTSLARVALHEGAEHIAVGHNADDQAETVLLHVLRGTGLKGLRGMQSTSSLSDQHLLPDIQPLSIERPQLIRPMLGIGREEIDAYCAEHGLQPRMDSTNRDSTYTRNRLRNEVIPLLKAINPGLRSALGRLSEMAAADYEFLRQETSKVISQVLTEQQDHRVRVGLPQWRDLPLSIQRMLLQDALRAMGNGDSEPGFQHISAVVKLAEEGETGKAIDLPGGMRVRRDYDSLLIAAGSDDDSDPDWPLLPVETMLRIEQVGSYAVPGSDWQFVLEAYDGPREGGTWEMLLVDPWSAVLAADVMKLPFTLRTRRAGDRFCPQGVGGWQKVGNFQTDHKIPKRVRDRLPLLICEGEIAWVCGWRVDERFIITETTNRAWLARFEKSEA